ncbi:MAG: hypothetical protein CVV64_05970 [Candidatus Wallbacteria bacterium HGW-Wallbacteria-1]|uniref:DUF4910 domain-containing protein n=1 Tax=Candidatus Wallbacteria bacterium HGW-Wallbacteria-1 TaxID=2013854 RepID=A0A2N1PSJ9_9BACT|nr:MAG: hypothetical protein CVV64_05970 [Candidatus Wallbacteria bacterium HGW-Wallbacteria-1]
MRNPFTARIAEKTSSETVGEKISARPDETSDKLNDTVNGTIRDTVSESMNDEAIDTDEAIGTMDKASGSGKHITEINGFRVNTSEVNRYESSSAVLPSLSGISVNLANERIQEGIMRHWKANRVPVSAAMSEVTGEIAVQYDLELLEASSGQKCLQWTVPPSWDVDEAFIETPDGRRIADFRESPLRLWTASIPFEGDVDLEELKGHILFDRDRPEVIPYHYRNGYRPEARDWGFCLRYREYLTLEPGLYRVVIKSALNNAGTLHCATARVAGQGSETFVLAAHLCHPAMVTDGLASSLACCELLNWLRRVEKASSLRYSYQIVLGPEYYAAALFLQSLDESRLKNLKGTLFLDMLGNGQPLHYQRSFQENSLLDSAVEAAFEGNPGAVSWPFRGLWGNDETFYNGPGLFIPSPGIGGAQFHEYHSDLDSPELFSMESLREGVMITARVIEALETDFVPSPLFRGPLHLSSQGLYVDPLIDPDGYRNVEALQILMDGARSVLEISRVLGIDFFRLRDFYRALHEKGLIEISAPPL